MLRPPVHPCFKPLQKQSVDIKTKWLWEALHDLCQNIHISNPTCFTKLTNAFFLDPLLKSVFLALVVFSYVWYDTSIRATINYLHIHFRSNQRRNSIQSLTPSPSPPPTPRVENIARIANTAPWQCLLLSGLCLCVCHFHCSCLECL